jgi:hypothetical protein
VLEELGCCRALEVGCSHYYIGCGVFCRMDRKVDCIDTAVVAVVSADLRNCPRTRR